MLNKTADSDSARPKTRGRSRGRPRGRPDTHGQILTAARALFLELGYRATTVRAIAAAAGVDSALISYHFGSKQALFAQSLALPCADPTALDQALRGEPATLAERLLDAVTARWDTADPAELALAARDDTTMAVLRDYLDTQLRTRIAEFLRGPHTTRRATAAVGVLSGIIHTRYLSPLPSIADLDLDEMRLVFAPALRAALRPPHPPLPTTTKGIAGPTPQRH